MMAQDPYLIRQMAAHFATELRKQAPRVEVRAEAFATMNGRPSQPLVSPLANLADTRTRDWIVPLR